jgi:hypothetical protein
VGVWWFCYFGNLRDVWPCDCFAFVFALVFGCGVRSLGKRCCHLRFVYVALVGWWLQVFLGCCAVLSCVSELARIVFIQLENAVVFAVVQMPHCHDIVDRTVRVSTALLVLFNHVLVLVVEGRHVINEFLIVRVQEEIRPFAEKDVLINSFVFIIPPRYSRIFLLFQQRVNHLRLG